MMFNDDHRQRPLRSIEGRVSDDGNGTRSNRIVNIITPINLVPLYRQKDIASLNLATIYGQTGNGQGGNFLT